MIRSNSLIEAAKLAAKSLGGLEFFKNLTSSQSLFDSSIDDDDDDDNNNNNYKVNHFDDTGMSNLHIAIDILLGENRKGDQNINLNQSSTSSPNKREKNDDRLKKRRLLFAKTYWEAVRTRRKASRTQNKDETYDSNSQTEALFKLILSTSPSTLKQGNKKEKNKNLPDTKTLGETLRFLGITDCIQMDEIDETDLLIDIRYKNNRTNGYIHDPFKTILESVVRRLVEDKVRAAVLKKDFDVEEDKGKMEEEEEEEEHRRILPRTLRWCEQVLMPWLALLLLGDNGLENAVLIKKKSEGRRKRRKEEEKKGVYNSPSYSNHLQRMNRISRVPHSQFSLTSSIAPELDDGSGGLTGVKDAVVCDENDMDADIDSGFIDLLFGNNTLKEDDTNTNNTDIDSIYRGLVLMRSCDRISFVHAHECIARSRSEEAFNLLRDWPSSKPALVDLREAITVAGAKSRGRLVSSIVHSFKTRLLHAGVATASVLDVCLAAVRSLRVVDVSGVMLALIVDPLQAFLRSRPDTIRCIVSSLTEDSGSELYKELETGTGRSGGEGGGGGGGNVRRRAWEDSGAGGADESDEEGCDAEDVPDVDDVETNENFLLSKEDEEEEEEEEEDIGMNNEATMTHKKYSKNKAKKRLLYLRSIFRPSVQQRLPTNPFTRGEAMFRSSSTYTVFSDAKDAAAARVLLSRPRGLWYPAPSTVDATREGILRGTHNSGDLLTLLVNIYGSRELFVAEYARVLSQKLLVKPYNDFILDQEERTVELLKVRFGEAAMIKCEAMMKDIVESKRISHAIRGSFIRDNETIVMTESTTTTTTTSGASNSESSTMTSSNAAATIAVELFPSSSISSISSSLGIPSDVEMKSKNKDILPRTSAIESETDCIIVSGRFWPSWQSPKTSTVTTSVTGGGGGGGGVQQPLPAITNQPENASLASILRKVFDRYATRFADVRKPRELILSPNFGEVTAEIEYPINSLDKAERKIMSVSGTPQQISVLLILAEDGENGGIYISLSVLASKLRLTLNATMRLISYWTNSNVLSLYQHKKKGTLVYITSCLPQAQQSIETGIRSQTQTENVLITTIGESNQSSLVSPNQETRRDDDDGRSSSPIGASFEQLINEQSEGDDLSGSTSNSAANEEAELVWTSYLTGMLTNLGKLPLDRIHNTLGLFASMGDHPYRKTQQETSRFLSELVRAGKIDVNEGLYSIR